MNVRTYILVDKSFDFISLLLSLKQRRMSWSSVRYYGSTGNCGHSRMLFMYFALRYQVPDTGTVPYLSLYIYICKNVTVFVKDKQIDTVRYDMV